MLIPPPPPSHPSAPLAETRRLAAVSQSPPPAAPLVNGVAARVPHTAAAPWTLNSGYKCILSSLRFACLSY